MVVIVFLGISLYIIWRLLRARKNSQLVEPEKLDFVEEGIEIQIMHSPQECDAFCENKDCPYVHVESWSIWEVTKHIYLEGPFFTLKEARQALGQMDPILLRERINATRLKRIINSGETDAAC